MIKTATVKTATLLGVEAEIVDVTVTMDTGGHKSFQVQGIKDPYAREMEMRVRSAIRMVECPLPATGRIVVSLTPADIPKYGTHLDLPVAMAVLRVLSRVWDIGETLFVGELRASGRVLPVPGVSSMSEAAEIAGLSGVVCPEDNAREALAMVPRMGIFPVRDLKDAINYGKGGTTRRELPPPSLHRPVDIDMRDIRGLEDAKEAVIQAVIEGKNILLQGPPGGGKTMLARRISGILPDMTKEEQRMSTKIFSSAGLLDLRAEPLSRHPFRAPHHTCTAQALVGGGIPLRAGEASLAHNGVLLLDDMVEFSQYALGYLREPLKYGHVSLSRRGRTVNLPAKFMLVGTANYCACGKLGTLPRLKCDCSEMSMATYRRRLDQIIERDGFNMTVIEVPQMNKDTRMNGPRGDSSETIKKRITAARKEKP